jgi:quinoprotein glucose dehydrogenase
VSSLREVWRHRSGDFSPGTSFEVTPILAGQNLVFCTPFNRVIALDPETGEERWSFDPEVDLEPLYNPLCRGVAFARLSGGLDKTATPGAGESEVDNLCEARIYLGTLDARLIAIDAETGVPCPSFATRRRARSRHHGRLGDGWTTCRFARWRDSRL